MAASAVTFTLLAICWMAAAGLAFIEDRPRWVEPYVAWRAGPTRVQMVAMTWGGLSLESRQLPWAPTVWPPARSRYEPEPDLAVEPLDGTETLVSMSRFDDASLFGFAKGGWEAEVGTSGRSGMITGSYVAIPFWFLFVLFGAMPARAIVRRVRERRFLCADRCKQCGYDLRASPQRCPECGTLRRVSLLTRVRDSFHRPGPRCAETVRKPSSAIPFPIT